MKKISRTKIKKKLLKKTNPEFVKTIKEALKHEEWKMVAYFLASSTRKQPSFNLFEIDKNSLANDIVLIPGKVLSKGNLTKKIHICSLSISEKAKEKLKDTNSEYCTILEEIRKNPRAEGVKILNNKNIKIEIPNK